MNRIFWAGASFALASLWSCAAPPSIAAQAAAPPSSGREAIRRITLDTQSLPIVERRAASVVATAWDARGRAVPLTRADVKWASSDMGTAYVNSWVARPDGKISASIIGRSLGRASITATVARTSLSARVNVDVQPRIRRLAMTSEAVSVVEGRRAPVSAVALDAQGEVVPVNFTDVEWSSSNEAVAPIVISGRLPSGEVVAHVTAVAPGRSAVTARLKGTSLSARAIVTVQRSVKVDDLQARTHTLQGGRRMPYRLFVPPGYDPRKAYPVVLFLHGAGGRGTDNREQLALADPLVFVQPDVQAQHPCIFVAPQCPQDQKWVNTDWALGSYSQRQVAMSSNLRGAFEILQAVQREFSTDPRRVYATGLSMGGYGTWDLVLRYPNVFAAAVPVCGGGDPSRAAALRGVGIWAFHAADDPVVPVSGSRDMVAALAASGQAPNYDEYAQGGHASWVPAYATPGLADWLFSFHK